MKTVLIDAHNLALRAYHTFPKFTNVDGDPTGMTYGFLSILSSYISRVGKNIIIVWEGGNNWRKEIYPEYKASRKEPDPFVGESFKILKRTLDLTPVPQMMVKGFEADDLIGWLVSQLKHNVTIISRDKDLLQLISTTNEIFVRRPEKDGLVQFDELKVQEEFGIPFESLVDYLAIVGDKSDNIVGLRGWGPVKTSKLLNQYQGKDYLEFFKPLSEEYIKTIELNKKLIQLITSEIDSSKVLFKSKPKNVYGLNQQFHQLNIAGLNPRELVQDLTPDAQFLDYLSTSLNIEAKTEIL